MGFSNGSVVNNPSTKLIEPLWKIVWRFLKKPGIKPPYKPALPLPGVYLGKTTVEKDNMYPNVQSSTTYNSQDMEAI